MTSPADPFLRPLAEAAAATYAGTSPWFRNPENTCQVYKTTVLGHPTYAFNGTQTFREWMVDFMALDVPWTHHVLAGRHFLGLILENGVPGHHAAFAAGAAPWPPPAALLCRYCCIC